MDAQGHVREAIVAELERQAANATQALQVKPENSTTITVHGPIDLDELALAVIGSLAGGP
jgi:hypothetical protein